jgi:ketopantoate reductase
MKRAILGGGAIGGLIGAALGNEGENVTLLVRPEAKTRYLGTLSLKTPSGTFETAVRIETKVSDDTSVLWIAVKAMLECRRWLDGRPALLVGLF